MEYSLPIRAKPKLYLYTLMTVILHGHSRSEWFRLLRNGMRAKVCNMQGMVLKKLCSTKLQICYWCEQLRCTLVIVAHLFLVPEAKNNKHIQQKRDIITLHCAFAMVRLDVPCNNLTNPWKLSFPSAWLIQSLRIAWTGMEGPSPSSCLGWLVNSSRINSLVQIALTANKFNGVLLKCLW